MHWNNGSEPADALQCFQVLQYVATYIRYLRYVIATIKLGALFES